MLKDSTNIIPFELYHNTGVSSVNFKWRVLSWNISTLKLMVVLQLPFWLFVHFWEKKKSWMHPKQFFYIMHIYRKILDDLNYMGRNIWLYKVVYICISCVLNAVSVRIIQVNNLYINWCTWTCKYFSLRMNRRDKISLI